VASADSVTALAKLKIKVKLDPEILGTIDLSNQNISKPPLSRESIAFKLLWKN
jgi:hypothetical protein